jgi:hypothetical protein
MTSSAASSAPSVTLCAVPLTVQPMIVVSAKALGAVGETGGVGGVDGAAQIQAWVDPPAIERIPSWDAVAGDDGRHPAESLHDTRAAAAQLDQLVALGYISPLPDDRARAVRETVCELDYNLARALDDGGSPQLGIPILERLWEEWPDQHRFGIHLLGMYSRAGRIAERRQALETLRERAARLAVEAREKLAALPAEDADADDPVARESPAARRWRFEAEERDVPGRGHQHEVARLQLDRLAPVDREAAATLEDHAVEGFARIGALDAPGAGAEHALGKARARPQQHDHFGQGIGQCGVGHGWTIANE